MSNPKIIVINGSAGVGKDTFVTFIMENYFKDTIVNVSTIDSVKAAARKLGWDGIKDEKGRKFLSELKYFANQYYPISVNTVRDAIESNPRALAIFVHCREPKEIDKIKEEFDVKTVLVKSDRIEEIPDNYSDKAVNDYIYDYTIDNSGSLEDLKKIAKQFITEVLI